jgi:hypothetical protein
MKTALTIVLVILAVLATGCTSSAPAAPAATPATTPAAPVIPALTGTWTGTMQGYEENVGYTSYNNSAITMVVTDQQGRIFNGYLTFGTGTKQLPLAGVLSRDGRTFTMVEDVNGYTSGELTGSDTMELTHIDDSHPYSAALDTLKKV